MWQTRMGNNRTGRICNRIVGYNGHIASKYSNKKLHKRKSRMITILNFTIGIVDIRVLLGGLGLGILQDYHIWLLSLVSLG